MDFYHRIAQIQAEHARCLDNDDLEKWPDFFAEDCLYKITTLENHKLGYEAGVMHAFSRGMLVDRVTALREANIYERQSYRHILGQPCITAETEDGAAAETSFLVIRIMRDGTTNLFASGHYIDRYIVDAGAVKIIQRLVVCDSSRIDTLLAIPL